MSLLNIMRKKNSRKGNKKTSSQENHCIEDDRDSEVTPRLHDINMAQNEVNVIVEKYKEREVQRLY